jgi:hypothetical protein
MGNLDSSYSTLEVRDVKSEITMMMMTASNGKSKHEASVTMMRQA